MIRRKSSSASAGGGSPGSKSLHLSPLSNNSERHPRKSQTLFTFPDPGTLSATGSTSGASGADTSADSGLSSILHVHERYLSSEDFHEALFFERSPKSAQRKRSRKSSNSSNHKTTSHSNVSESIKKLSVSQI